MLPAALVCFVAMSHPYREPADDFPAEILPHIKRARELFTEGQFDAALAELDKAVNIAPKHPFPYQFRAAMRYNIKDYDGTIRDCDEALKLERVNPISLRLRGSAYGLKREYAKAVKDLEEAIRLSPDDAEALNSRAWIAATCPVGKLRDGVKALEYSKRACETNKWKNPYYLGTYAAACAENGKFEEAVQWQKQALQDKDYSSRSGESGREMLRHFEQGKPYREQVPSKK